MSDEPPSEHPAANADSPDSRMDDDEGRALIVKRLEEADLGTERFIDVENGRKVSYDHTEGGHRSVNGNYGVCAGGGLVELDVDDYKDDANTGPLDGLSETLAVDTPPGGEHRYYQVKDNAVEVVQDITDGSKNARPTWGEVHTEEKYVLGPESQLDGCSKDWCDACETPDGGHYAIGNDRPIAAISPERLAEVLRTDPAYRKAQRTLGAFAEDAEADKRGDPVEDPSERDSQASNPDTGNDRDHTAALPNVQSPSEGWGVLNRDRRHMNPGEKLEGARKSVRDAIEREIRVGNRTLIDALPATGKSTGFADAAQSLATHGVQMSYLCPRVEIMIDMKKRCEERGLVVKILPSFTRDCPTVNENHPLWGEDENGYEEHIRDLVMALYRRGVTPQEIHKRADQLLGVSLPCQEANATCPHTGRWGDEDEYDVLIGHYLHAYVESVVSRRALVFDEFPAGTYVQEPSSGEQVSTEAITAFLSYHDGLPAQSYLDLIEHRGDDVGAECRDWFEKHPEALEPESELVLEDGGHAQGGIAAYTVLNAEPLGNGFERTELPEQPRWVGVHNRADQAVCLLMPPDLRHVKSLTCLDGTPTHRLWELALGTDLRHNEVLTQEQKQNFIEKGLGIRVVRTSEHTKPYSGGNANIEKDAVLLEAIGDEWGKEPDTISTSSAMLKYEQAGVVDLMGEREHYGNLTSSNQFAESRLGCVIGSRHYGDSYVQLWGAFAGEAIPDGEKARERSGQSVDLSYGGIGDEVLRHMREHQTLQAVMRFGRDGKGAVVYVHTNALPEWVPLAGEGYVVTTWSKGMREVIEAAKDLKEWTNREVLDHPAVESIDLRQVQLHMKRLCEEGFIERGGKAGNAYVYKDSSLSRTGRGLAELDSTERPGAEVLDPGQTVAEADLTRKERERVAPHYPYRLKSKGD